MVNLGNRGRSAEQLVVHGSPADRVCGCADLPQAKLERTPFDIPEDRHRGPGAGRWLACAVVEGAEEEMLGVNSRIDLAQAEAVMQARLRQSAMENGATLIDPATVHFCHDTQLGRDVTIDPYVVFGPGVVVEDGVHIRASTYRRSSQSAPVRRVGYTGCGRRPISAKTATSAISSRSRR